MRLVQRLRDFHCFLHVEAKLARTDLLQRAEIERERRDFADPLGFNGQYLRLTSAADLAYCLLGRSLVQAPTCSIGGGVGRHPVRGERIAGVR